VTAPASPLQVGNTAHNVGGLVFSVDQFPQSISPTTKKRSVQGMVPPTRKGTVIVYVGFTVLPPKRKLPKSTSIIFSVATSSDRKKPGQHRLMAPGVRCALLAAAMSTLPLLCTSFAYSRLCGQTLAPRLRFAQLRNVWTTCPSSQLDVILGFGRVF